MTVSEEMSEKHTASTAFSKDDFSVVNRFESSSAFSLCLCFLCLLVYFLFLFFSECLVVWVGVPHSDFCLPLSNTQNQLCRNTTE